jgi:hypothetical protein
MMTRTQVIEGLELLAGCFALDIRDFVGYDGVSYLTEHLVDTVDEVFLTRIEAPEANPDCDARDWDIDVAWPFLPGLAIDLGGYIEVGLIGPSEGDTWAGDYLRIALAPTLDGHSMGESRRVEAWYSTETGWNFSYDRL